MRFGIFILVIAYVLSQFYRAFLAVLSPFLGAELGAMPEDLALSSGLWFMTFAVMQVPVGAALDAIGPRRTAAWLLGVAGGGGALNMPPSATGGVASRKRARRQASVALPTPRGPVMSQA